MPAVGQTHPPVQVEMLTAYTADAIALPAGLFSATGLSFVRWPGLPAPLVALAWLCFGGRIVFGFAGFVFDPLRRLWVFAGL